MRQGTATLKDALHSLHISSVPFAHVNVCQLGTVGEHPVHVLHTVGAQVLHTDDFGQIAHRLEPTRRARRTSLCKRIIEHHASDVWLEPTPFRVDSPPTIRQAEGQLLAQEALVVTDEGQRRIVLVDHDGIALEHLREVARHAHRRLVESCIFLVSMTGIERCSILADELCAAAEHTRRRITEDVCRTPVATHIDGLQL